MEMLTSRDAEILVPEIQRMARAEYNKLGEAGFFEDEKVELLFGMVVAMTPIDPAHVESTHSVGWRVRDLLAGRADVYRGLPIVAAERQGPQGIAVRPR